MGCLRGLLQDLVHGVYVSTIRNSIVLWMLSMYVVFVHVGYIKESQNYLFRFFNYTNQSWFGYDAIYVGLDTATVTCEILTACLSDSDVEHIVYSKVCFKYNVLIIFLRVWKALRVPHQLLALTLWKLLVSVHLVSFSFMNVLLYSYIPLLNSSNF